MPAGVRGFAPTVTVKPPSLKARLSRKLGRRVVRVEFDEENPHRTFILAYTEDGEYHTIEAPYKGWRDS
jgi:hypothetical protein